MSGRARNRTSDHELQGGPQGVVPGEALKAPARPDAGESVPVSGDGVRGRPIRAGREFAVTSPAGARAARENGADRVELCTAPELGGLTPSAALVEAVAGEGLPVQVLVRCRPGDFVHDAEEIALMAAGVRSVIASGASGVVIGALTADGALDTVAVARLAEAARASGHPVDITLHRAVDRSADPVATAALLPSLGLTRDLDVATESPARMADIAAALRAGLEGRGWRVRQIETDPLSARLVVTDAGTGEQCEVDILKEALWYPAVQTDCGPVLAVEDVVGTKVRALADRGLPRDLIDVHAASDRWPEAELEAFGRRHAREEFSLVDLRARLAGAYWIDAAEFEAYGLTDPQIAALRRWAQEWEADLGLRLAEDYGDCADE
ncbi:copper homeostasis protein CutC [Streptomyces sp. NBC_00316]|uniref:copper homeostasis protein CutC n=1 Tax=Streptomyces sp. NBC_00316 TaxID=2975710 RepID=UPI002E2B443E|nr:copper homeostasis protein CutC [Streptomyces sp. NBC_00316]